MFTIWFRRMFRQKVDVGDYNKITSLTEVNNMLTAIADEIMEKGIKKGMQKEKLEVAKKLKDEGLDIALISKTTGLTEGEIEKL